MLNQPPGENDQDQEGDADPRRSGLATEPAATPRCTGRAERDGSRSTANKVVSRPITRMVQAFCCSSTLAAASTVRLPTLAGHDDELWDTLIELSGVRPGEWTLIGGQMVFLHAIENGATPPRISTDLDRK